MIPMRVRKEHVNVPTRLGQITAHKVEAKNTNAGTRINDNLCVFVLNKTAGRIATEISEIRAAGRQGTSYPIIFYFQ